MYLVGNADEWWGYYWKAFVTGKDKNRTNSCRQLLLKITACSLSQKLSGMMELLHRARRGKYEKTWPLLHARLLTEKFPPPTHTFLLPPQDRKFPLGSLRGSEGTYACSSHLGRSKQSLHSRCCQGVGCSAKGASGFRQPMEFTMHKTLPTSPHCA